MKLDKEIKYREVDGKYISMRFVGQKKPAPPLWVKDWVNVSPRYQYASLAEGIAEFYPPELRRVAVNYVKNWPEVAELGIDMVISGQPHRMLTWTGVAVMNEIAMRFGQISHFSCSWFNIRKGIPWINDLRGNRDFYKQIRNSLLDNKLLLIDGITDISELPEGRWFVNWLYQHRFDNQLPTITTIGPSVAESWDEVTDVLGRDLTGRIKGNAYDYIAG